MSKEHIDVLVKFGERIRSLRSDLGFSQEAFADQCGLDRSYVGGVERGERNISLRNLTVIADALEMPLSQLLEGV